MLRRLAALLLCMLLMCSVCVSAGAEEQPQRLRVYFDGLLSCRGFLVDGQPYIPLQALCSLADIELRPAETEGEYTGRGIKLALSPEEYLEVNGRYLFCPGGAYFAEGKLCLPADTAARIFSCRAVYDAQAGRVDIETGGFEPIGGGADHYKSLAGVEDIFWLSRILYSEAGQQGLEAMLAVGQVVLNRVESPNYPNTVFEVVFDRAGGVQFTPVQNGTVFAEPSELAEIAAYMCYEGFDLVGSSLYFVNPAAGDDSWFKANKVYCASVGGHDFYTDG